MPQGERQENSGVGKYGKLSAEQVGQMRNSTEMTEIIIGMRSLLDLMKSGNVPRQGSLMGKAVNYLDHFWKQVFLYRKDGAYTIDNSLAERCIRPLANERKNSLFFGSDRLARVSAAYHSVVSICRLQGGNPGIPQEVLCRDNGR